MLSQGLHRTVALLGLTRLAILAMALSRIDRMMIVVVRMGFSYGKWELFKEMMDAMRCRRREKKNE